ncbi:hypothetical protein ACIRLA_25495 [Streptomyces sp. NPDC102364]|uniref:hypothetical protein n=1 Tax=Streptomyces sp. NPDC102364 TaxID=3366161 RepID=UPI00381583DF
MTTRTLLAHLAHRFKARHEPLATEALCYLANTYGPVREALGGFLRDGLPEPAGAQGVRYRSEAMSSVYEGRPDIIGEVDGLPMLMIEGKFDAGLTVHQPNGYLAGLPRAGTLLFVCPGPRVSTLARQLAVLIPAENKAGGVEYDERSGALWLELDDARHLAVIGWRDLIEMIRGQAGSAHPDLEGELRQMDGMVHVFESSLGALTREELSQGVGNSFAKGVVATRKVVEALRGRTEISSTTALGWKIDRELGADAFYFGTEFAIGSVTVYVGFEPTCWTPHCPSPVSFWIMRPEVETRRQRAVHDAYLLIVEAFNTQFRQFFDGLEFHAEDQAAKWWWAPIPIPPDSTEQERTAVVDQAIASLLGQLSEVHKS